MKNIFYFILGICLIVLTSATTVSVMTIKPAIPVSTVIIQTSWANMDNTQNRILNYAKQGYIVRSTVGVDTRAFIIMEKY
jgi:hypothetical protein